MADLMLIMVVIRFTGYYSTVLVVVVVVVDTVVNVLSLQ